MALGRRIGKLVSNWDATGSAWVPATHRKFIYEGWNLIAELNAAAGNALLRTYAWGLDLSGSKQGAGGVGGLVAIREGGNTFLPVFDGNGNVMGMTTAAAVTFTINGNSVSYAAGSLVAAYEYDAFGQTLRETGPYAASNPIRFSTKYTDSETGQVYYGYRFYSPSLGRFINRDPIEEQGGINLYAFVGNNGVSSWDYLGLVRKQCRTSSYMDCIGFYCEVKAMIICEGSPDKDPRSTGGPRRPVGGSGGGNTQPLPIELPPPPPLSPPPVVDLPNTEDPAPNNPERWSDEKCKVLAAQIAAQQSSLNSFRNTHGGSYVDNPGLAAQKGAAEFARLYGGSASDYVSQGVGWAGVASVVAEVGARRFGGASAVRAVEAGSTILSGVTHPTNLGLAGNDLNHGSRMSAAGNFAGAAGDVTALVLTGAQAAPVYGWILAGGSAAIFISEQTALGLQRAGAAREIAAHYSNLTNIEAGAVARIDANNRLYETHCGGK